ncbi:MAG: DUF4249 domain-containing protein [Bacteroidota bacterium]|nr:DUF4249 domain-containing protein [Bacteroidota bacterium]
MQYLKRKYLVIVSVALLLGIGCKKVIQVNLKNVTPRIVITGEVNNQPGPYIVTISKTVNYTSDNAFPPVSGALVIIAGNGNTDTLTETSPGTYATHTITGRPGRLYSLYVSVEGKVYTSASTMPQPVQLDSIGYAASNRFNDKINAITYFQDPPDVSNYYQFNEYLNQTQFQNNRVGSVFDDRLSDGKYITYTLYNDSTDINKGDTLTIQMNCIDENVYNYLNTLSSITDQNSFQSPTPDNPTSNISNNALGYFSANTIEKQSVIIR